MKVYGCSITSTAAALYGVLCSLARSSARHGHVDTTGTPFVFASRRQLGEMIERSERTAQRAIIELRDAGLIRVQRMGLRRNDRIFIVNGVVSSPVNNVVSEITINNSTIDKHESIDSPIATAEIGQTMPQKAVKATKGRPTPRRQPRITAAIREAARAKYRRQLENKLKLASPYWLSEGTENEYRQLDALIDIISRAMSCPGRQIRVQGAGLTVEQYWATVQNITPRAISGLFERVSEAENRGGVRNPGAYMLASVYQAVQWDALTQGA